MHARIFSINTRDTYDQLDTCSTILAINICMPP